MEDATDSATRSEEFYFQEAPQDLKIRAENLLTSLSESSKKEGLVAWLLGTDCWSQALLRIEKDCRSMSEGERTRLTIYMLNCLLKQTHLKPVQCTQSMSNQDCVRQLDSASFGSFTVLLSNIHTICLSIQNRDFALNAERMTHAMALSTRSAAIHLQNVESEMKGLSDQASSLHDSLFSSIDILIKESKERQDQIMHHWKMLEDRAVALEERQGRYEESFARMLSSTTELSMTTDKIHGTINQVIRYEERAEEAIQIVLGRKAVVSDLLFYLSLLACALLLGAIPKVQRSVPKLLLVILVTIMAERSIPTFSALCIILHISVNQSIQFVRGSCLVISFLVLISNFFNGSDPTLSMGLNLQLETIRRLQLDLKESIALYRELKLQKSIPLDHQAFPSSLLEIDESPAAAATAAAAPIASSSKKRRIEKEDN